MIKRIKQAHTNNAIGICMVAIGVGFLATPVFAQTSNEAILGIENVPCNGVSYPVLTSYQVYNRPAGDRIYLVKDATQTLTVTNGTVAKNEVTKWWEGSATVTAEVSGKAGVPLLAEGEYTFSVSTTWGGGEKYTNGTDTSFSVANAVSVIAKVNGVSATPSMIRMQGWGAQYKCDVGTTTRKRLTPPGSLEINVTVGQGWIMRTNGALSKEGDFVPPSGPRSYQSGV